MNFEIMYDELDPLFEELINEFRPHIASITNNPLLAPVRFGSHAEEGQGRYDNNHSIYSIHGLNHSVLVQHIRFIIYNFPSTRKIIEWVLNHQLWPREIKAVDEDLKRMPSVSLNIVAGFIVRNFVINDYNFTITPGSFTLALSELKSFFDRDTITITTYLSLYGPHGDLDEFQLGENVWLQKANFQLAQLFCRQYSSKEHHYIEMYDGDYVLKITYTMDKKDFLSVGRTEKPLFEKWFSALLLVSPGNIERGKIIRETIDWPLLTIIAPHNSMYNPNLYGAHQKSNYILKNSDPERLETARDVFGVLQFENLDKSIHSALRRLGKAKASLVIDDRVVELALALEYLINTKAFEVTLQLCLKGSKLYAREGEEESTYKLLSKFYSLRSKVVHGNSTIEDNEPTRELIATIENIISSILFRLIELNKKYSFKQISEALDRSLYLPKSLDEILEGKIAAQA